jgi:hypothetical protein
VKSEAPYVATDGTRVAVFNSMNTAGAAGLFQALDTEAGHTYVIEFDVGNLGYNSRPLTLWAGVGGAVGTHTYTLASETVVIPGTTDGRTRWVSKSLTFTPQPGQEPMIAFWDQSTVSNNLDLVLDRVRVREIATPPVVLENGGFESGLDGWEYGGSVVVRNSPPYLASEGSHLAVFNSADSENNGYLARSVATIPGQRYLLTFDVGNLSYKRLPQALFVGSPYGYKQWLFSDLIEIPGPSGGATVWISASYPFTANSTTTRLWFSDSSTATSATDLVLDNVRITPVVPTPDGFFNGSFENGFAGWDVNMSEGRVSIQSDPPYAPTDGTSLAAFSNGNSGNFAMLSQTIDTIPGRNYELVLDVGNLSYVARPQSLRTLIDDGNYRLENKAIWIPATSVSGGTNWLRDQTYPFTARGPRTTFTFLDASMSTVGVDLVLDNIRLIPR